MIPPSGGTFEVGSETTKLKRTCIVVLMARPGGSRLSGDPERLGAVIDFGRGVRSAEALCLHVPHPDRSVVSQRGESFDVGGKG